MTDDITAFESDPRFAKERQYIGVLDNMITAFVLSSDVLAFLSDRQRLRDEETRRQMEILLTRLDNLMENMGYLDTPEVADLCGKALRGELTTNEGETPVARPLSEFQRIGEEYYQQHKGEPLPLDFDYDDD